MPTCSHKNCSADAIREIRWLQPEDAEADDGPGQWVSAFVCADHIEKAEHAAAEAAERKCNAPDCPRVWTEEIQNTERGPNGVRWGVIRVCEEHAEAMMNAKTLILDGRRVVLTEDGHWKALPPNIGQG